MVLAVSSVDRVEHETFRHPAVAVWVRLGVGSEVRLVAAGDRRASTHREYYQCLRGGATRLRERGQVLGVGVDTPPVVPVLDLDRAVELRGRLGRRRDCGSRQLAEE